MHILLSAEPNSFAVDTSIVLETIRVYLLEQVHLVATKEVLPERMS